MKKLEFIFMTFMIFSFSSARGAEAVSLVADTTPSGTILAFALSECPTGWSTYHAAEGRFVSGFDSSDPTSSVGSTHEGSNPTFEAILDLFSTTATPSTDPLTGSKLSASPTSGIYSANVYDTTETPSVDLTIDGSTQPPSVVLLYCRKDES